MTCSLLNPPALSRVSAGDEPHLRSFLILAPVLVRFVEGEKKLKRELAGLSLEDHTWYLKNWDEKEVGLVKVHCCECGKDFGIGKWDHNNASVLNLFSNFKKSHINSTEHIQMYCYMRGKAFEDHSHFQGSKGKPMIMIPINHKNAIAEGIRV
jgi:hypothetical protein